jgi:hypothetical protein
MANYKAITATSQVKNMAGKIKGIFVSSTSSGTIAVYDSALAGTTDPILAVFTPAAATMYQLSGDDGGVSFNTGLYVVLANTIACTIIYE